MKKEVLISFRSITFAQRAERLLQGKGLFCVIQRTPKSLAERGCSYCLRLREEEAGEAIQRLREARLPYGKVYGLNWAGEPEEWAL